MFKLLILTIFLSILTIGSALPMRDSKKNSIVNRSRRMLNGTTVLFHEIPSQVGLLYYRDGRLRYGGAGSIISNYWVVTVAHCTCWTGPEDDVMKVVSSGSPRFNDGQMHTIVFIACHPGYEFNKTLQVTYNDIALVRVDHPFGVITAAKPIPLFKNSWSLSPIATAYGWGSERRDGTGVSLTLNKITVELTSFERCHKFLNFVLKSTDIKPGQMCGIGLSSSYICYGDSGGSLIQNGTLLGLISWIYSDECGVSLYPGVFVDIRVYSAWIEKTMIDAFFRVAI